MKMYSIALEHIWNKTEAQKALEFLNRVFPDLVLLPFDPEASYWRPLDHGKTFIATQDEVISLKLADISFSIEQQRTLSYDQLNKDAAGAVARDVYHNTKVEVHASNSALMVYNETLLCEDYCTDRLQNELDNGWRIIACCVQPDQRRPDYILGRYNPKRGA